jgi:hypothetical protein
VRPHGQIKPPDAAAPIFAPTRQLDYELELAAYVGTPNPLQSTRPNRVSSASRCSTTGPPATSSRGSTSRSAHSSGRVSPPASPRGSSAYRRSHPFAARSNSAPQPTLSPCHT